MSAMEKRFKIAVLLAVAPILCVSAAEAQQRASRDEFPFSIMTPEPGARRATPRAERRPPAPEARPAAQQKAVKRQVRRGSSTVSTIPTYRSPLTPLGTVRPMPTAPSLAYPASPPAPVPGTVGVGSVPAVTPPRPAGQGFQDRAGSCIASGSAQGVGPGQIGSFTQSCVNR
jgi:hypothetical protein